MASAPILATTADMSSDGGTAVRRQDYIAPAGTATEKMPVLADMGLKRKKTNGETSKPAPKPIGATIKLAPLPTASQPSPAAEAEEAAPQTFLSPATTRVGPLAGKKRQSHLDD